MRHEQAPGESPTVTDAHIASPSTGPSRHALRAGEILAGRYRVSRFIAGGGMGEVYEADDALLRESVAVKLLRPELLRKPGAQDRFADEIKIARKITHRNVCRVFDVGTDGERVFYTMELHSGGTLATLLQRQGRLAAAAAAPLVRQLLDGVAAAHAMDVVHQDLKPSNALLAGADQTRLVLTDFGLAVPCCFELGCRCAMPHLLGTPFYMAPEQVEGGMALERTDVFALGVILYEMTTGALPYRGASNDEIARARLSGDPPSPRALVPDLDAVWDDTIRACLARDPAARPRNARAVAAALGLA
ncbi:MAG TPA: serine/threonine-protein kinase [Kofleriaceae bacterium]|nr:serine/threonine-protein kinase [Kofleriaceae bacterium]